MLSLTPFFVRNAPLTSYTTGRPSKSLIRGIFESGPVELVADGFFKFNDYECSGPMTIDSVLYTSWPSGRVPNIHRHHSIEGYCESLPRGTVRIALWVGRCRAKETLGSNYTGHSSVSRIMIEEVPPSQ